jgi:hypothetical protein
MQFFPMIFANGYIEAAFLISFAILLGLCAYAAFRLRSARARLAAAENRNRR